MTRPTITAFEASPDEGQGLARDMRVRWALEEVGQPYDVRLVSFAAMKQPAHLALQPFGQIPTYQEAGGLAMFESGAIILHIARSHPGLLPVDPNARGRAVSWFFAALNTVEPPVVELEQCALLEREESWYAARLPMLGERITQRFAALSRALGDAEWLVADEFTAGDLMMVMVLRRAEGTGTIERFPNLVAYKARGEARPAYRRAYAAQEKVFTDRRR